MHLAGFAPAFTLSLCDSEYARKPPVPIASVVSGHSWKGKKPIQPVYIVDENSATEFDLRKIDPNDIASIEVFKNPEETKKYTKQDNGVIKIYTKNFVLTELNKVIKAKTKEKIILTDYDKLKKDYCLSINGTDVDFAKVISIEKKSIAKLEIIHSKDNKTKIMIVLKKQKPNA